MYPRLQILIKQILDEFNKFFTITCFDSPAKQNVLWYTICGYDGRIAGQINLEVFTKKIDTIKRM
jgi:hypothetical protein